MKKKENLITKIKKIENLIIKIQNFEVTRKNIVNNKCFTRIVIKINNRNEKYKIFFYSST